MHLCLLCAAVTTPLSTVINDAVDRLPVPIRAEARLGHRLCEMFVHGPGAGKSRSLICDLAGRPAVLIYARELSPELTMLLTKLDVVAQRGKAEKMLSSCVLLTTKEQDQEVLSGVGRDANLGATILATHEPVPGDWYFGSNPRCTLHPDATVTVIVLHKLSVQSSYAFRNGELKEEKIREIVKAASGLLPETKP